MTFFVCFRKGECTGISFVDSITLDVCDSHRIQQHKVFQGMAHLTKKLFGKLFADKGYVSQKLFHTLFKEGIGLVTKQKKNAKKKGLCVLSDQILLRKRAIIESVNDFLKNICQIEHSRHRSCCNFVVNLVLGLAAYSFLPKRPSIRLEGFGLPV